MEPYAFIGYGYIIPNPYLLTIHNVQISLDAAPLLPLNRCP
jgi:hypothetical protein